MPLAGDQQHIIGIHLAHRGRDGLAAVGNFDGIRAGFDDGGADRRGVLGTWIVIGDIDKVGIRLRGAAHNRTFAGVAVTASAKDNGKPAACFRAQCAQRRFQRVRRVRIIDNHPRAGRVAGNKLHAAFGASDIGKRPQRVMNRQAAGMRHHRRCHGVHRLERAGKCHRDAQALAIMLDSDINPEIHRRDVGDPEIGLLVATDCEDDPLLRVHVAHHLGKACAIGVVDIDHRTTAGQQKLGEQARFRCKIGFHVGMVVEVVAAEVGETGNVDIQAVKAMLREAMAACLKRQMRNSGAADRLQRGMQADRVGCCQRGQAQHPPLHRARIRPLQAQRADRGGIPGCTAPDLADELDG